MSSPKNPPRRLADLVRPHKLIVPEPEPHVVAQVTIADLIAEFRLTGADKRITEANFPTNGAPAHLSEMRLLTQEYILGSSNLTTDKIMRAFVGRGYRFANLTDVLHYAKWMWNGKDLVVGLGSSWVDPGDHRYVPCLYGGDDDRQLCLYWDKPEGEWRADYSFLVIRK